MNETVKRIVESPWTELAARWIVGATFLFASFHKIMAPEGFAKAIYSYELFPAFSINLIAVILPFMELFTGLALICGVYHRAAAIVVSVMLVLFIGALSINLIRGHQFDCGCFSLNGENSGTDAGGLLVRDILFFVLCAYVLFYKGQRKYCIQRIS